MKETFKLGRYLLISFFLTLILIGVIQILVNSFLGAPAKLMAENILQLEGALDDSSISGLGALALRIILIIALVTNFSSIIETVDKVANTNFLDTISDEIRESMGNSFRDMTDEQAEAYIAKVIILLVVLILIWLLPFIIGGIVFTISTSHKIRQIERLRAEKEKEFDRQRNLLLSDVAHDIKTPMTTIAGFSKALADGDVPDDKKQEYLNAVYGKTMQANELVSVLFEYVKLDSAGFAMECSPENICELVRECVAGLYMDFEEKKIEIIPEIPEAQITVNIDKIQTRRAINNLLTNALKHNPSGTKVMVEVTADRNETKISISDDGNFIERETAAHIFDPFIQGDKSRKTGSGSGLGLSVTKKIIDMQEGKIILYQYMNPEKYGKVKTFEITLPRMKVFEG